jgi:hypothetical protein
VRVIATERWRAPRQDGSVLAEPPLDQTGRLLADSRQRLAAPVPSLLGRSLPQLRRQASREALALATDYLRQADEPVPPVASTSLILAGHQPELFHPGVWVKNFALNSLARCHGCTPLNLVVDNDTAKSTALRLPVREEGGRARLETLAFDHWSGEVPFEERAVRDEAQFADFADRATPLLEQWGFTPILPVLWAEARRQAERTRLLGERLVAARRSLERRWGCHNLEVPLSALCRSESFAWFACHILVNVQRFHAFYNAAVGDYRRLHGIRSRNHPVPDLAREGDWWEVPFWAWRAEQAQRSRLFVQPGKDRLLLRAGTVSWPALPLGADHQATVSAWLDLERQGLKVRSRALTTTLFARLLVGDLFIHGIGGGKYDALTDELLRRFYALEAPRFLVLSATLHLPIAPRSVEPGQHAALARELRDLHWNPQRYLDGRAADPQVQALLARKRDWIARESAGAAERRERFQTLRELTGRLRSHVPGREEALGHELAVADAQLAENAVLQRRDYAFCLFPEQKLRPFCDKFLGG